MNLKRMLTCWSCAHCGDETEGKRLDRPERVRCTITKRMGKLTRAYNCEHFEYMQRHSPIGDDGIPIKNRQPLDYRTRNQWQETEGRRIKEGEKGILMHSSRVSSKIYEYFLVDQTEVIKDVEG